MGDRKPKKTSSGNADAHKAKLAKDASERPVAPAKDSGKKSGGKG